MRGKEQQCLLFLSVEDRLSLSVFKLALLPRMIIDLFIYFVMYFYVQ